MSLEITIYFYRENAEKILDVLLGLPDEHKPLYYSSEGIKEKQNVIKDTAKFEEFKRKNQLGYCMFGDTYSLDFSLNSFGLSHLYIVDAGSFESYVPELFRSLSSSPIFGYAALKEEYRHRNQYHATIEQGESFTWIGRDLEKYLSGVYWYTLVSDEILEKHSINIEDLRHESKRTVTFGSTHLLQFFEKPENWQEHAKRLDEFCERRNGIFSRNIFDQEIKTVDNFMDEMALKKKWS